MKKEEINLEQLGYQEEADFTNFVSKPSTWYFIFTTLLIIGITIGGVSYVRSINSIQDNKINAYVFRAPVVVDEVKKEQVQNSLNKIAQNAIPQSTDVFDDGVFDKIISDKQRAANMLANNSVWTKSSGDFLSVVLNNIPDNGFNSNFAELNQTELEAVWNILQGH